MSRETVYTQRVSYKERVLHIMNKKILAGLLAIILVLAVVLVGCSKPSQGGPDQFASSGTGVEDWDDIIVGGNESGNSNDGNSQSGSQSGKPSGSQSNSQSSSGSASVPTDGSKTLTYKEYLALSAAEQYAYFESFDSFEDYWAWRTQAMKAYKDEQNVIRVEGDGSFNIGDYIN